LHHNLWAGIAQAMPWGQNPQQINSRGHLILWSLRVLLMNNESKLLIFAWGVWDSDTFSFLFDRLFFFNMLGFSSDVHSAIEKRPFYTHYVFTLRNTNEKIINPRFQKIAFHVHGGRFEHPAERTKCIK
jgi:hypothetical protein